MNSIQNTIENRPLTSQRLIDQNHKFHNSGGVSSGNRSLGFVPGFKDSETGKVYRSCFSDGQPAPFHILEGLPCELLQSVDSDSTHTAIVVKRSVIAGFILHGLFYTRSEAAQAVSGYMLQ